MNLAPLLVTETVITRSVFDTQVILPDNVKPTTSAIRGAAKKPRVQVILTNNTADDTTYYFRLSNTIFADALNWDFLLLPGERVVITNYRGQITCYPTPADDVIQISEGF